MGCGASQEVEKKQYAFRVRLLGGLNLYNNGFGVQVAGTKTSAGRFEGKSDPFVQLECTGSKQFFKSEVRMHEQNPVWNEEFYFNCNTREPVLKLVVKDKDVASTDDTIGTAEVPLHGLIGQDQERECWVPLDGARAKGEIGFSVIECYRKHITAVGGRDVKPMDSLSGSSDCYLTVPVGQQKAQQTAIKGWTLNPVWNETFTFYVPYSIQSQVEMILYDHDTVGVNTNMGWHYEMVQGKPDPAKEPKKMEVEITNAQGTLEFKILDDVELEDVPAAQPVTEEVKKNWPSTKPRTCNFEVRVLGAYNLAAADHNPIDGLLSAASAELFREYKEYSGTSDPFARVECEGVVYDTAHYNNTLEPLWNERFRFVASDRENSKLSIGVWDHDLVSNDKIGAVDIPLNSLKPGQRQEIWSFLDKGRGEIGVELLQAHQLHIKVMQCTHLPAKDMNGMCDPYVKLTIGETQHQTRVVRNNRAPLFEEDFRFAVPAMEHIKLKCEVWDSDLMIFKKGLSEDLIGMAEVALNDLKPGMPTKMEIPLTVGGGKEEGYLHLVITDEIPLPPSVLGMLAEQGEAAFNAAVDKINDVKECIKCAKLPNFDNDEEPEYEVADPKLAPRPRFGKIAVEVVALRGVESQSPLWVGVAVPQQGTRKKTAKEYQGPNVDIGETFEFGVPSKETGALEFCIFESHKHSFMQPWHDTHLARVVHRFPQVQGDGLVRGQKPDDEWLELDTGKGKIIIRVYEQYRFQVRVLKGRDINTKMDPYVMVQTGPFTRITPTVSSDPKKDRTSGVPGQPVWDTQFTFFTDAKSEIVFRLRDESITGDTDIGRAVFDLSQLRRGVPKQLELELDKGGFLTVEVTEEEKMGLADRIIDAAANAAKLAASLASEVADKVSNAASAVTGAIGGLFGK